MDAFDIIVIDSSDQRIRRVREMFGKYHDHIESVRSVENAIEEYSKIKDKVTTKILIWHVSSSIFEGEQVSYLKIGNITKEYFDKRSDFKYKFAVSNDDQFREYSDGAKWFSIDARDWDNFSVLFQKGDAYCLTHGLKNLPEVNKKEQIKKIVSYLLHLFLPLDIDMQALADKKVDKQKYLQEMKHDLADLYKSGEYAGKDKNKHYRQKFYDLWYLLGRKEYLGKIKKSASVKVNSLTPIDNPSNDLLNLSGFDNGDPKESPIYKFLESLDAIKVNGKDLAKVKDYLLEPFKNKGLKINDEEINSFHDWYCALAKCLRGKENG